MHGSPIRWDRIARLGLVAVLVAVALLAVGPARGWWESRGEERARTAELHQLQREHAELRQRKRALATPEALEREARELGYVRPGEKAYVLEDLPGSD